MANDRFYRPGDNYILDDIRGFKVRASRALVQWNGMATTGSSFSPRQPQDLVKGVRDDQSVALARPRQTNRFTVVGTTVSAPGAIGANTITVMSAAGFNVGDACQVMLDSGVQFPFTLASYTATSLTWTGHGLPATVGVLYGSPIENQVLDLTSALVPVNETPSPSE